MSEPFDFIEMKIPAKAEYVGVIRLTISGVASRMGYSYDDIEDLKIAVSEACTNAIHHAYPEDEKGEVAIGMGLYKDHIEVMVADHGKSFDWQEIRKNAGPIDSTASIESLSEGGLGIYLIETLMDDVKIYDDSGVVVTMKKFINNGEVESSDNTISTSQSK